MKKIYLLLATACLSFSSLQAQTATEADITAYQSAWTTADGIKTVLTGYDPTLNNLKASGTTDYGKFDAGKITLLQSVGSTYLLNSYSTSSTQSVVTAATTTLQSVKDLLHEYYYNSAQYYFAVANNRDGWYRIKVATSAGNYKYLTYSAGNKFLTVTNDETQIWYATRQTNVTARIALSVLSDLRTGTKRIMSGSGTFFELFPSGTVASSDAYTLRSGGTGQPTINGINASTGAISYTGSPAFPANRDFSYRLILESVTDLSTAPSLADANYTLQFNGTAVAGIYAVANNLINIGGTDYPITQYGNKYAIGSPAKYFKSAALDSELEYSLGAANAVPYPGFTFTQTGSTTASIAAYKSAWTTADSIKTVLMGYDPTLENLKASGTTDYGKFEASKIAILQSVGSTYLLNSYSASSVQSVVTAATTTLQSVKDLLHEYYYNPTQSYFSPSNNQDGWYRVKIATSAGNYKYLTYSSANKFLTVTNDETQIWYATRYTNINARIVLSVLSDLRTGTKHTMSGSGAFFELFASGTDAYTMKTAGTGGPVISGIDASTGAISYTGSPAFPANRDFSYRLILERVTNFSTAPSLVDGNYTLQFNGTAVAGTYAVANNLINIGGTNYAITQYGNKYAIGSPAKYFKSAALDSELQYTTSAPDGANAVPYPGFTFTQTCITSNSGNWSTASNWIGGIPSTGASVTINHDLTLDQASTVGSLTINSGKSLTVNPAKQLTVSTTLTNNGTLNLLSDATGTATILTPATISGSGTTSVQQYFTGALNSGTGFPNGRFWYVATPVTGVKSNVFDAVAVANKLWYYTESAHGYTEITDNTTDLTVGTGYVARLGANSTVNFSGTGLYTGNKIINLTYNSGHAKSGYNLIGNPYPSYLDWHAVTLTENVMPTIWVRSFGGGAMGFDTYNSATGAGVSSNGNNVTRYIAPMQAFWVEVNANSAITVTNDMRYAQDQTTNTNKLKTPAVNTATQQLLRLQVTNGFNSDESIIAFNANASDTYDRYDSHKMLNNEVSIPEIYTYAGDDQLAINCMNSMTLNKEYALGFSTAETNHFEIKATEINNLDAGTRVMLKDKLLNRETELSVGTAYPFASDAASASNRFSIIFRAAGNVTGVDANKEQNILVYRIGNNRISVVCNAALDNSTSVSVYNAVGQKLTHQKLTDTTTVINAVFTPGVYVVVVNNAGKQQISKMAIK